MLGQEQYNSVATRNEGAKEETKQDFQTEVYNILHDVGSKSEI